MHITKQPCSREEVRLIWTDLEMSGLEPDQDKVLEAAFIITDGNLREIAEAPPWVLHQPDSVLDNMDEWNTRTHTNSGLIGRCRASTLSEQDAEEQILAFLRQHVKPGESPMCGNSIGQDRRFMVRHLPQLEAFFHYRNFDVSTFKIAVHMYAPDAPTPQKSESRHQALDDIKDSIEEMRRYVRLLWPDIGL